MEIKKTLTSIPLKNGSKVIKYNNSGANTHAKEIAALKENAASEIAALFDTSAYKGKFVNMKLSFEHIDTKDHVKATDGVVNDTAEVVLDSGMTVANYEENTYQIKAQLILLDKDGKEVARSAFETITVEGCDADLKVVSSISFKKGLTAPYSVEGNKLYINSAYNGLSNPKLKITASELTNALKFADAVGNEVTADALITVTENKDITTSSNKSKNASVELKNAIDGNTDKEYTFHVKVQQDKASFEFDVVVKYAVKQELRLVPEANLTADGENKIALTSLVENRNQYNEGYNVADDTVSYTVEGNENVEVTDGGAKVHIKKFENGSATFTVVGKTAKSNQTAKAVVTVKEAGKTASLKAGATITAFNGTNTSLASGDAIDLSTLIEVKKGNTPLTSGITYEIVDAANTVFTIDNKTLKFNNAATATLPAVSNGKYKFTGVKINVKYNGETVGQAVTLPDFEETQVVTNITNANYTGANLNLGTTGVKLTDILNKFNFKDQFNEAVSTTSFAASTAIGKLKITVTGAAVVGYDTLAAASAIKEADNKKISDLTSSDVIKVSSATNNKVKLNITIKSADGRTTLLDGSTKFTEVKQQ